MTETDASVLPPGPAFPKFVQAIRMGRDPLGFFTECAQRYGDCFTLRLPGGLPKIVCNHPDDIRRIFALKPEEYSAAAIPMHLSIGRGSLVYLDGDAHLADRKIIAPLLVGERLNKYWMLISKATDEAIQRWVPGYNFAPSVEMQHIALNVIIQSVFGITDPARIARLRTLISDWLRLALSPVLFLLGEVFSPLQLRAYLDRASDESQQRYGEHAPAWRKFPWQRLVDLKGELQAILADELQRYRKDGDKERSDMLALLATARYEDGSALSDQRLIEQLVTLLVAGHESTASTMAFTLGHLVLHPEVIARAQAELAEVVPAGELQIEHLPRLRYLDACIQESMRLSPIALAVTRVLTTPLKLSRWTVPAGYSVLACPSLTHKRADTWTDPDGFRPERFLNNEDLPSGAVGRERPREAFYPFGGGRRRCVGMNFATFEMRVVLARILSQTALSPAPGSRVYPMLRAVILAPDSQLRLVVDSRAKGHA